jgi:hypothetical protein
MLDFEACGLTVQPPRGRIPWPRKFSSDLASIAVAGWLGSYGGEASPDDISRGMFAGKVGSPRLVKLFDRLGIKTTCYTTLSSCLTATGCDMSDRKLPQQDRPHKP